VVQNQPRQIVHKTPKKRRADGVVQGVGPESKNNLSIIKTQKQKHNLVSFEGGHLSTSER
jgi:hypothetical protein